MIIRTRLMRQDWSGQVREEVESLEQLGSWIGEGGMGDGGVGIETVIMGVRDGEVGEVGEMIGTVEAERLEKKIMDLEEVEAMILLEDSELNASDLSLLSFYREKESKGGVPGDGRWRARAFLDVFFLESKGRAGHILVHSLFLVF